MNRKGATTRSQTSKMSAADKQGKAADDQPKDVKTDEDHADMDLKRLTAIVEQQAEMMLLLRASLNERDEEMKEMRRASKEQSGAVSSVVVKIPATEVTTPMPYSGETDFSAYLRQFMVVAGANKWSEEQKRSQLTSNLSGVAVTEVDLSEEKTWAELCAVLKKAFSPVDTESFASELRSRKQGKGETLESLVRDIKRLVKKANPDASAEQRDKMSKSHFIEALRDSAVRQKIRDFMPKVLDEALEMAKRFRCNQKTESRLSRVYGSDSSDEEEKVPTTKPVRKSARAQAVAPAEVDYMAKMEESFKKLEARLDKKWKGPKQGQQGKGRGRGKRTIICFHCQQPDHFARECPYADQKPMFRPLTPGNQAGQTQNQGAPEVLPHSHRQ